MKRKISQAEKGSVQALEIKHSSCSTYITFKMSKTWQVRRPLFDCCQLFMSSFQEKTKIESPSCDVLHDGGYAQVRLHGSIPLVSGSLCATYLQAPLCMEC